MAPAVPGWGPGGDAGSGRDAGDTAATAVPVEPGRAYDAVFEGVASMPYGDEDLYRLEVPAGRSAQAYVDVPGEPWAPSLPCLTIEDADGDVLVDGYDDGACTSLYVAPETAARSLYLRIASYDVREVAYEFATSLDHEFTDVPPAGSATPEDDGGSGRDAGDGPIAAVRAEVGAPVSGQLREDDHDYFRYDLEGGRTYQLVEPEEFSLTGCLLVRGPDERPLSPDCRGHEPFTPPLDGPYFVSVHSNNVPVASYEFTVLDYAEVRGLLDLDAPRPGRVEQGDPTVVVLVSDTGVNPYHDIYRRPELTAHPCTYVEGYDDCSVPALELTLGVHDDPEDAYAADAHVWAQVEPHTHYWIPGTNLIAVACGTKGVGTGPAAVGVGRCIMDDQGHGTATTSSVLTEAPEALLVVNDAPAVDARETMPVVPDVESSSVALLVPVPLGDVAYDEGPLDESTLYFQGAGNEALVPTPLSFDRANPRRLVVGGGAPDQWTAGSWTVFDFASWYCRPVAPHDHNRRVDPEACGTSFSTPTAAGTAAAALLELRRLEGYAGRSTPSHVTPTVTRDEFVTALRHGAALGDVERRFPNDAGPFALPLPPTGRQAVWGHGFLDRTEVPAIVACATGGPCEEEQLDETAYHDVRRALRERLSFAQDDAESGGDAGSDAATAVRVQLDRPYTAASRVGGGGGPTIDEDAYLFEARADEPLRVRLDAFGSHGALRQVIVSTADGTTTIAMAEETGAAVTLDVTVPSDGTYLLTTYSAWDLPHEYEFELARR